MAEPEEQGAARGADEHPVESRDCSLLGALGQNVLQASAHTDGPAQGRTTGLSSVKILGTGPKGLCFPTSHPCPPPPQPPKANTCIWVQGPQAIFPVRLEHALF